MTTKSTFQGYVRTYGGQDRNSGVTPGTLIASEVITFLSSTATATAVSVGATVNANAPFVLPQVVFLNSSQKVWSELVLILLLEHNVSLIVPICKLDIQDLLLVSLKICKL